MRFLACFVVGNICVTFSNATPFPDESDLGLADVDAPNKESNNDWKSFVTPYDSNTLIIANNAGSESAENNNPDNTHTLTDDPNPDPSDYLTSAAVPENHDFYTGLDNAGSSNIADKTDDPNCQPTSRKRDGTDNTIPGKFIDCGPYSIIRIYFCVRLLP